MAFLKIDKALGEYYAALGKSDYYNADKKGKFLSYCQENGFEEDDIDEEFGNSPDDCMYPDFDEDFPLNPPVTDATARQAEIFRIIKYCYDNSQAPISKRCTSASSSSSFEQFEDSEHKKSLPKDLLDIAIETDKKTQKECNKLYREQCPLLYNEEDVLKRCFAISMINNRYPFLINLVDSFLRDKCLYQTEVNDDLSTVKWRNKSRYFKKLNKEQKKMSDTLTSGVETYLRRGCTSWDYGPNRLARIEDSMNHISQYILMVNNLVQMILKENPLSTPFQIDVPIALRKIKKLKFTVLSNVSDEDQSDHDSDDSDGDSDDDFDDQKYKDYVGDVEKKVSENKLPFYSFEMKTNLNYTHVVSRNIKSAFIKFSDMLSKSKKYENYPHRKRFCIFIDRRVKAEGSDKIIIFEPPSNCNSIPNKHVPEWYFNASKTCIIPGSLDNGKPSHIQTITANSNVDGQVLTISFQVDAQDIIKVYIFWMGRYTRLYPQDLQIIFPQIFDIDSCNNKKWDKKQQNIVLKQLKFIDTDFETFYHQVSYKTKHNEFPKRINNDGFD